MAPLPNASTPESLLRESAWLQRLAHGLVRDDAGADDLAQDARLEWLRAPSGAQESPRGWLRTVARRRAARDRRASRRRRDREALVARTTVDSTSPEESAARLELARVLAEELQRLPEPYRSTLYRHYYEGTSPAAISASDGVAGGTVRWRLSHGRTLLRGALEARDARTWRDWAVALAPLAGGGALHAPAGVVVTSGLLMSFKSILLGALAGMLAGGGSLLVGTALGSRIEPAPNVTRAPGPRPDDASLVALEGAPAARAPRQEGATDPALAVLAYGRIVDARGRGLRGATLTLVDDSGGSRRASAGSTGGWSAFDLAPGSHELEVTHDGFLPRRERVEIPADSSWRYDATLAEALTLPVRFEDLAGQPIPPAAMRQTAMLGVAATRERPDGRMRLRSRRMLRSEAGTFLSRAEFDELPELGERYEGVLQLSESAPLWVSVLSGDVVLESRRIFGDESELVFAVDLEPSFGSVRVRVVERETGRLVETGIHLEHASGGVRIAPELEDGALVFHRVPPVPLDLSNGFGELEWLEVEVHVDPGGTTDLGTLELGRARPFTVRTVDENGAPIVERVSAVRPALVGGALDLGQRVGATANAQGETEVAWLAPGETLVRAGGRGGRARVARLVDTNETRDVELVVPKGLQLEVSGLSLAEGEYFVLEDAAGAVLRASQREPRSFLLAPGDYAVRVVTPRGDRRRVGFAVDRSTERIDLGGR